MMDSSYQKGFIIAPVLIWVLLTVSGLFVGTVAVKEGLISIKYPLNTQEATTNMLNPTPSAISSPQPKPTLLPTYKPSLTPTPKPPQGQVQGVTTNQNAQKPKYDGTRTGRIIDYKSLCEGKIIKVYENELIQYKRITGEAIYTTRGDIKCYEDQINQLKNEALGTQNIPYQPSTPSEPTITCVLSYGTYQLTQTSCDSFKASDKPYTSPQYYSCTICYPYSPESCLTYNYLYKTKEECDAEQQKVNQLYGSSTTSQPTPELTEAQAQAIIDQHNTQVTSCRSNVGSLSNFIQRCTAFGGSAAEACRQIYGQQWQSAYDACGTLY